MKITKQRLKEIIKEELSRTLDDKRLRDVAREAAEEREKRGEPPTIAGTQNLRRFDPREKQPSDPDKVGLDTIEMTKEEWEKLNKLTQEDIGDYYRSKKKDRDAAADKLRDAEEELKAETDPAKKVKLRKKVKDLEDAYDQAADTGD